MTKQEIKAYQQQINDMRAKVNYAECFTPHKVQYYRYLLIELLNNAPVHCH
jgi:hypothetical protein